MKLTEMLDSKINWAVVSDWHNRTPRREGMHIIHTFLEEAAPFVASYTWLSFYLWCLVRTRRFTSSEWYENWDAGHLGGHYLTSREGIREAAREFAKFDDSSQLAEEAELLAEFAALKEFAAGANPEAKDPVVEPPRPTPKPEPQPTPVEPPKPQPQPVPAPPASGSWKKTCAMLAGVLGAAIIAAKLFAPGWVVLALEALRQLLAALGG